jgi:hypothetical protein
VPFSYWSLRSILKNTFIKVSRKNLPYESIGHIFFYTEYIDLRNTSQNEETIYIVLFEKLSAIRRI